MSNLPFREQGTPATGEGNNPTIRIRKDIGSLREDERDTLIYAFHKIQTADIIKDGKLNNQSYYVIAGYHGQPFRGAGYGNANWWGGFCHHGNILFPTWHRAYLYHLEKALRAACGDETFALPYWNELDPSMRVPEIFTQQWYTFHNPREGVEPTIDNPLYSYKLQQGFVDHLSREVSNEDKTETKKVDYGKPRKYETVRCPYSGLVGPDDVQATEKHNEEIREQGPGYDTEQLNKNVKGWLVNPEVPGMGELYVQALDAPNYAVFSNTTSATKWNEDHHVKGKLSDVAVPLEKPHNGMHLAIGGYDLPDRDTDFPTYPNSNGDMGENDTAAFDPIFWFHHCFVDLVFWKWQLKQEDNLAVYEIPPYYPGTSPIDNQGGTPGMTVDGHLNLDTPLTPFEYTSYGVLDTETQLGYRYEIDPTYWLPPPPLKPSPEEKSHPLMRVSGISRARRPGSFVVSIWACKKLSGNWKREHLIAVEPVFSRWHVSGCANCTNSLGVTICTPLPSSFSLHEDGKQIKQGREDYDLRVYVLENESRVDKDGKLIKGRRKFTDITAGNELDLGPWVELRQSLSSEE